ncbi:cell-cycle control medial ring component-domain-containing protein [Stachybotrys elegans]|uniref:Cell-cycle control medial ring component-domain-containing protein n=1 Tax=Stachybotrys elegans TaxID=80388 RepID=A0A8K0SUY4_9HYPO|nr:cell-cycle control medial ring component-domain-containing protein [Stachybotrys elegans]
MAEVAFAKTFLTTIDSRPIKLSPDHVEDARRYPSRMPHIMPRMPKPMSKPTKLAPGQERSITVTAKSLRNPPLDIKLSSQSLNTSILDIKNHVSSQARIPADKIKILQNKRPVPDSKVLKDVVGDTDTSVEFSIMVMGGAASILPEATPEVAAPSDPTGAAAVQTDAFWADLKGFLMQRLKDEQEAESLSSLFKSSWEAKQ